MTFRKCIKYLYLIYLQLLGDDGLCQVVISVLFEEPRKECAVFISVRLDKGGKRASLLQSLELPGAAEGSERKWLPLQVDQRGEPDC